MQDKHLYEYSVIRLVPRVEREEFFNVGIILFSKSQKYISAKVEINTEKFNLLAKDIDINFVQENLQAIVNICKGEKSAGPIALLDPPSKFRWLTAIRSSTIQTSRPHPGFSDNLDNTLNNLLEKLVK